MNPTQSLPYLPLSKSLFPVRSLTRDGLLVLGGSLFLALLSQAVIPLQPVPITLQTLGVLLVGAALGSRLGFLAVVAYLLEGLILPVFAGGATWFHPRIPFTAGYLLAFPFAAYLVGYLVERYGADRSVLKTFLSMLLANLLIYAVGVTWLGFALSGVGRYAGVWGVLQAGMFPFLVGDLLKAALAAALLPIAWRLVRR
ncbi:MAG: biotin transporter BioY [Meiothermus sp.]|uniref:biotin transporter BioY n=1 Tax=Meiothermus sp. TaxID=1955249 RepID=UPI0025E8DF1E|nr:biotin transporter BioY [Meiothermus sp.]MCS7059295.1 biotin transporter BioY [Meiothermus sp.]MCS7195162.1 biotin transporter BioY [Meiothermus sp.]MCX7740971.1 biotin transporter BioY [Meiothermus sp.]MDW8091711.1 biotin transporter BioY [Meiothermus sp.]MDW8482115.1 biotin transporter BioY [Meiothermus sp.]